MYEAREMHSNYFYIFQCRLIHEYVPVMETGSFEMKEDTVDERPDLDPVARMQEINEKLDAFGESSIFRRHITSKLKN